MVLTRVVKVGLVALDLVGDVLRAVGEVLHGVGDDGLVSLGHCVWWSVVGSGGVLGDALTETWFLSGRRTGSRERQFPTVLYINSTPYLYIGMACSDVSVDHHWTPKACFSCKPPRVLPHLVNVSVWHMVW